MKKLGIVWTGALMMMIFAVVFSAITPHPRIQSTYEWIVRASAWLSLTLGTSGTILGIMIKYRPHSRLHTSAAGLTVLIILVGLATGLLILLMEKIAEAPTIESRVPSREQVKS